MVCYICLDTDSGWNFTSYENLKIQVVRNEWICANKMLLLL